MLHGKIEINGHEITDYKIVNTGPAPADKCVYMCIVEGRDNHGYPYRYEFDVLFRGTGPALVAHVLIEVDRRLTQ